MAAGSRGLSDEWQATKLRGAIRSTALAGRIEISIGRACCSRVGKDRGMAGGGAGVGVGDLLLGAGVGEFLGLVR